MKRWRLSTAGIIAVVLVFVFLTGSEDPPPSADSPGPVGIWKVPYAEVERANRGAPPCTRCFPPAAFRYDGCYVTECLGTRWSWEWCPDDSYWRLESAWDADDLYASALTAIG